MMDSGGSLVERHKGGVRTLGLMSLVDLRLDKGFVPSFFCVLVHAG